MIFLDQEKIRRGLQKLTGENVAPYPESLDENAFG